MNPDEFEWDLTLPVPQDMNDVELRIYLLSAVFEGDCRTFFYSIPHSQIKPTFEAILRSIVYGPSPAKQYHIAPPPVGVCQCLN